MNNCRTSFECSGSNGCRYFEGRTIGCFPVCNFIKKDNHGVHTCANRSANISAASNAVSALLQTANEAHEIVNLVKEYKS